LLCCFWFAFLSVFLLGQLLDCVLVHYQHFCGFRQVDSPACKIQFNCLPRLNVCNDLAEAMKALDGKKTDTREAPEQFCKYFFSLAPSARLRNCFTVGPQAVSTQCFAAFACCARIVLPFDLAWYSCPPRDELG